MTEVIQKLSRIRLKDGNNGYTISFSHTGLLPPMVALSRDLLLIKSYTLLSKLSMSLSYNPFLYKYKKVWAIPRSLAATRRMVTVPRYARRSEFKS